ncbi:hypothetical protein GYA19_05015 [Candidatus Beckwithbacteria bacterium]|nr:hypothetical protein [Candidatus Beckwithbacteria bacterium]
MAQITKLIIQGNKKRVNVYLDGLYSFSLPLDFIAKFHLKTGAILDSLTQEKILKNALYFDLYNDALWQISIRLRSQKEVEAYLINRTENLLKKYNLKTNDLTTLINKTVEKLIQNKYLDDEKFAKEYVYQRVNYRQKGKRVIRLELLQKGIDEAIIEKVLATSFTDENKRNIQDLIAKIDKQTSYRHYDNSKKRKIFSSRLISRGFSWDEIKNQIDEYLNKE